MTDFKTSDALRPSGAGIYTMRLPQLLAMSFEYHPETKHVYVLRGGFGTSIAHPINSADEARHVVLYWGRGYLEGKSAGALLGR